MTDRADTFIRSATADWSSGGGNVPSDGGSAWVNLSGTWGIAVGGTQAYQPGGTAQSVTVLESSIYASLYAQVTLDTMANTCGLCLRALDNSNRIQVQLQPFSGPVTTLFKRVGGSFTTVGSAYGGAIASGDTVKLAVGASDDFTVYINTVSRITGTATIGSGIDTATRHGLHDDTTTTARFSAFSITGTGGGGSTFKPAWAVGANQIIGGGYAT